MARYQDDPGGGGHQDALYEPFDNPTVVMGFRLAMLAGRVEPDPPLFIPIL